MLSKSPRTKAIVVIVALLLLGVAGTVALDIINADRTWTGYFYTPGGPRGGWAHGRDFPWALLYDYGEIPALAMLAAALVLLIASIKSKISRKYARPCLVVILTVVIGPGLFVNGIFKNYWGRPRPVETSQLGGEWEYRKVWEPGTPGRGKSFPCGHCSMAFSVASGVAFFPLHPAIAVGALVVGMSYGTVMGIARMAQGGHYPTDALWAAVMILVLITGLYYLIFRVPEQSKGSERLCELPGSSKALLFTTFVVIPTLLCLFHWPVYREARIPLKVPSSLRGINVQVSPDWVRYDVALSDKSDPLELRAVSRGFGFPWARFAEETHESVDGGKLSVKYSVVAKGFLSGKSCDVTLWIPCKR
ncbi:MAG: phosphatase PAP2 family protein [Desulfomonile tiedjei]|uniref:Phosphatase PAP2 family protein n=1 Tax=Desulfomonile tiedjei TaxID=2358 RepID=A0A9D6V3Z3_9BACT|nr:phosphatase PAP2 family protein [Desulfomonile tiedjei]